MLLFQQTRNTMSRDILKPTIRTKFPHDYSAVRKRNVCDLKCDLLIQQSVFTRLVHQSKKCTPASYKIAQVLAKWSKPFENWELAKEAKQIKSKYRSHLNDWLWVVSSSYDPDFNMLVKEKQWSVTLMERKVTYKLLIKFDIYTQESLISWDRVC